MGKFYTFPHANIRVIDQSAKDVYIPEEVPMHIPCFPVFAQKGKGMTYGVYDQLRKKYGEATFDPDSPYFTHQSFFLRSACKSQPVFMYRLIPDDAETSSLVLEAHVWEDEIPQWQRATDGKYLLDANGNKIPVTNQRPNILDLTWNLPSGDFAASGTFDLVITAEDPESGTLTYNVVEDSSSFTTNIEQDTSQPNVFHITLSNTIQAGDNFVLKITVTDTNGESTIGKIVNFIGDENDGIVIRYYWLNKEAHGNETQRIYVVTPNPCTLELTSDDSNVQISQPTGINNCFDIIYPTYDSYPHDVNFTLIATTTNADHTQQTVNYVSSVQAPLSSIQITKPGIRIKWKTRPLASNETITGLLTSEYVDGSGNNVTVYPILAFQPSDGPGAYGNDIGFSLWWDHESDTDLIQENQALLYNISFYEKPYGYNTPVYIRDFYNTISQEFMFYPEAKDSGVDMAKDLVSVLNLAYRDLLPVEFHVYTDHVKTIGERIKSFEDQEGKILELTTPWMANIFDALSTEMVPYYRTEIVIDSDSIILDKDIIHYMEGGSDGDISSTNFETLSALFWKGELFPEFQDDMRYPFNHIYDSGYKLETKEAMFDMLALKNDVHILVSTQSVYDEPNTEMEDQSVGAALRSKALLFPESAIDGTQTCRVTIFSQYAENNFDPKYKNIPLTFFGLFVRCKYHNTTFIKGEWKGLPNSSVDFINKINWAPYLARTKQLHWDTGINYCEYYDMTRLHYPDIISVYPLQTSLLSSDTFVTYLVYLKQVAKFVFRKYVGREEPVSTLKDAIEKDLNKIIYNKFKDYIKVIPSVYQTDLDKQLGFALTMELAVYDSVAKRVFNIPIYVRRIEDLNQ